MHSHDYHYVSANKAIVFTTILLSFISFVFVVDNQAHAALNSDKQFPIDTNNQNRTKHSQLQSQVVDYLKSTLDKGTDDNVRITIRNIDPRINIPDCQQGFQYSDKRNKRNKRQQANISVKITCAEHDWYLFSNATISVMTSVVVSKSALSPGTLLNSSNLELIEVDQNSLRGSSFAGIDDIIGARIKRRVRAGNVIDSKMLCFVCKGDRVTIAAISGGLSIKVYGVAQQDGILGDTIEVKNISSNKSIFARISGTSEVEVSI